MSEEVLRQFLERVNSDSAFRETVNQDPGAAFAALDLSEVEIIALGSGDEDALRRLAGMDVSGYVAPGGGAAGGGLGWDPLSWLFDCASAPACSQACFTPNSKKHCGTGNGGTNPLCCDADPDPF